MWDAFLVVRRHRCPKKEWKMAGNCCHSKASKELMKHYEVVV
jgi:hypothetical protein